MSDLFVNHIVGFPTRQLNVFLNQSDQRIHICYKGQPAQSKKSHYMSRITNKKVTAQLISAFVFPTRIVQFLFFLNLKFQAPTLFQRLYRLVCDGPCRKPRRPGFITLQLICTVMTTVLIRCMATTQLSCSLYSVYDCKRQDFSWHGSLILSIMSCHMHS